MHKGGLTTELAVDAFDAISGWEFNRIRFHHLLLGFEKRNDLPLYHHKIC